MHLEGVSDHYEMVCLAIGKQFEAFEQTNDPTIGDRSDSDNRFRPEVADLKNPGDTLEAADKIPCETIEELGRGGQHDIEVWQERRNQYCRNHIGKVVQRPFEQSFVWRDKCPDPNDLNAIHHFSLKELVAISFIDR